MSTIKNKTLSISLIVLIVFTLLFVFVKNNIADVLALEESNYDNISLMNGDKKSDDVILIEGTNGSGSSFTKGLRSDLTDVKFISNANYFLLNPKHHKNNGSDNEWGTCTTVAMQLLLGYHNYYSYRRIIPSSFLSTDYGKVEFDPFFKRSKPTPGQGCEKIGTGDGVYDEIFSRTFIAEVPGIGQMIPSVVNGTKSFINEYAADEIVDDITIAFGLFSSAQAREDIDNGLPIVLGMNLLLEAEMHVVPAYGYAKLNGVSGFLVHYGWGDEGIMVWAPEYLFGYQVRMNVAHTHNLIDTGENIGYSARTLKCAECGYIKVDRLYDIEGGMITALRYPISKTLLVPNNLEYYNEDTANFDKMSVSSIGNNAFADQSGITGISLPDSITNIGDNAFAGCTSLASINIHYGVTSIGAGAFSDCSALQNISISKNITSIGAGAFV